VIQTNDLRKTYKQSGLKKGVVSALDGVSFSANDGCITGLLGANGAGKSTTLRIISALVAADDGSFVIDSVEGKKHSVDIKRRIGYMPHDVGLYPRLTGRENIEYFAKLCGLNKKQIERRASELIALLDMTDFCDRRCEGYSQGQKTKTALARVLINEPKNLILDEPTNGLDVLSTRSLRDILIKLKEQGHCILLSSHVMQEVTMLCDSVVVIDKGRSVIEGSVNEILLATGTEDFEDAFVSLVENARAEKTELQDRDFPQSSGTATL